MPSTTRRTPSLRLVVPLVTGATLLAIAAFGHSAARSAEEVVRIPPPAQDATAAASSAVPQKVVFAGGCFWGVQGVFEHVKGVQRAVSGYAGGVASTASYETVSGGRTGHAESVEVTYDPTQVSFGTLLQVFFSVAHDPTQLNRQGPDSGTQYRSAIFATSPAQLETAKSYVAQLDAAHVFHSPIVTKLEGKSAFYPAEAYHQDFMAQHPSYPYIVFNDAPKVEQLQQLFPDRYRRDPVLTSAP